ncbi:LamG-like jellyroll fold domain-containing protein [Kitasatospora cathayae]|uniref:LamG domain-containing protein n=1 Tax=Kitasatospora cathayae TaxID=3004092 RepID=A0ABY7QEC7_9ACTN|nr:LamG-like jellyroll fold domain-containing protein [Kitasatospora sp. HUAS 3-15]WBP91110.1 LamG domain-containing protein [Kitasatospora sp. HUAS 3-15]
MALLQTVALQPAEAFAREHAPSPAASVQAPQVPQQRSEDAGRQGHQVDASETSRHAGGGVAAGHTPAPGEAPEKTDRQDGGKPHAPAAPEPVKGEQVTPPALPRPQASNADGSPKSQGEAAAGQVAPTKDSSAAWVGPTDPAGGATEVIGARTSTTSVFQNPDGTKTMRVYSQPVHFRKPDGTWDNIDTGLSRRRDNRWAEAANDQALSFSSSADGTALIDWTLDAGHRISYTLQGAKPVAATAAANTLTYPGALPDSDVVYNTLAQGIKESLVLHSASAPATWVFPLNTTGLSASLDPSGNVRFTDEAGKVRMTIPHGFMEDSALDPHSGEGVTSNAVTYKLTTVDGKPALQMDLDTAWLKDPKRVFPVKVDPTGQINGTRSTYIVSNSATNHASENSLKTGSYNGGSSYDVSYLVFDSLGSNLGNMYVQKAELDLNAIWSGGCQSRDVAVHAITSAWDPGSVNDFSQVPFDPAVLASDNFTAPNSTYCPGSPVTVPFNLGGDPTTAGVQLVNSWTHGAGNYGFALTSDASDIQAWKQFDSVNTQHPPFLKLTYVDWAASYSIPPNYIPPTAVTAGSQQVTMTNLAANWWNSNSMRVKPRFFDANWHEFWPGAGTTTGVPGLVKTGDTVTFTATIPPMAPGTSYQLCWDGVVNGTYSLSDDFGIPYHSCTWVAAKNVDPQIDMMVPLSNSVVSTLSPQLYASGHDPDNYPGTGVDYNFRVYTNPSSGDPQLIAESGWQPNQTWAVPAGKLAWNSSYQWTVMSGDHIGASPWSGYATFSTQLQQPVITSHLGGAASDGAGHDFDAHVGNYTTAATDASVKSVGPALTVTRSYNSLDPRTSTLFGAGWTSAFDMQVQPDADGTGSVVLTTANGRTARFGLGAGNVYTPPPGEFASLTKVDAGFDLTAKDGIVYQFHTPNGSAFALSRVTDAAGHTQDLTYTNGSLGTVKDNASGRALHFEWTTDNRHVAKVYTDPTTGTDWNTAQTWTYTYDSGNPDQLDSVCTPPAGTNTTRPCTTYTYTPGSHLRSAILDSAPVSYWRLGESSGTTAASEVIENQGNDNATYSSTGVTLGTPGPAASATAATFNGTTGYVTLPQTALASSSYTSVGLWFKTTGSGVLFSYQTENFPGSGTTAGDYTPALYVGTSGKLHGKFWAGSSNPMQSSKTVNDGQWHFALLSASGASQTLYLDGQAQATLAGPVLAPGQRAGAIGGGFTSAWWQDSPFTDYTGRASYFTGSISDVAFYNRTLGAPTVQALWQAGSQPSTELSGLKLPSGKTQLAAAYDTTKDRASQITDGNGGTWKLGNPTVSGSSQEYRGQIMGSQPAGYWRLSESQGVQAANQVYSPRPTPNNGTYSDVTLGAAGPMTGSTGSASFNGSTSWTELPASYAPQSGPGTLGVWFKTSSAGVLLSYQSFPLDAPHTPPGPSWNPALYVGTDGKLHAQLWTGDASHTMASAATVNDGKWHFAVLSADSPTSQQLYVDGAQSAGPLTGTITPNGVEHVFVGAGAVSLGWPAAPSDDSGHFNGQIADVVAFPRGLDSGTVANLYQLATTSGATQYDAAVVDAHPTGYWRMGDTTGNQATELISSAALAQNRGSYHSTTCCQSGPWASGTSTATGFDGTASYIQLPANTAPKAYSATTVELWFKTKSPGVIYGYQDFPLGADHPQGSKWNPALYVGTDGKLYGALWTGDAANALATPTTVNDGAWHHVALSGDNNGQTLYLDGAKAAASTVGRPITYNGSPYVYLGAGTDDGNWPNHPTDVSGHLNGAIAEFAIYSYPLTAGAVAAHYRAATTPGTTGGLDAAGAYRATVVQAGPIQYWRLNDPSGSWYAAAELGTAMPDLTAGTYSNVTLNANGPSNDYGNQRAAVFNGTTSQIQLPSNAAPTHGPASMELWFNTTSGGPLYSYQDFPVGSPLGNSWNPALYVGSDGHVHGEFWMGQGAVMTSDRTVNDGKWHQVVLAADDSGQTIYIDGQPSASDTTGRKITFNGTPYVYLGAGTTTGWNWPGGGADHFTGSIAEASYYTSRLDAATVAAHFKAMGNGGTATPVTTANVTDPTGNTLSYRYDARTAKLIAQSDAWGHTTRYTYDTNGFLHTVTDADGHTVTTGHDDRGNVLSRTTCQDTTHCHTSYAHYYLDTTPDHLGAVNDTVTDRSDARSNGPGDATYRTQYTYDPAGELLSTTVPATPDFPQGRTSYVTRTSGSETAVGSDGNPTTGTQPAGLVTSQSPYVDHAAYPNPSAVPANLSTVNSYNAAGDLTKTVSPLGLITTYTYDNLGRLTSSTEACTNCGQGQTPTRTTTTYTWDGQGNPLTRTDPATTDAVTGTVHTRQTTTAYDTDGNPLTQTLADLTGGDAPRTTTWAYSGTTSHLTKVTDPAGRSTSYTYDKYGNKVSSTDAAGTTYNYDYAPMGWLQQTTIANYTGSPTNPVAARPQIVESRAYDPAGRLARVTDAMGRSTHTYYNDDDTVAEIDADAFHNFDPVAKAFDGTERNVVLQQNTYDAAGHLTQRVTGGGKTTVANTWDAAGRATSTTVDPGGLNRTSSNTYDAAGHVLRSTITDGTQTRETDLGYDVAGNITTQTAKNPPQDSTTTFTYDQRGLPLTRTSPNGNVSGANPAAYTVSYLHDAVGQQTVTTEPPVPTTTLNLGTGQPLTLTVAPETRIGYNTFGETAETKDPTGGITTTTHTFDATGEHLAVASNTYTAPDGSGTFTAVTRTDFDTMGRPKVLTDAKGNTATNTYDQLGNLVEKDFAAINGVTPKWLYTQDLDGETQSVTDPTGAVVLSTYDDLGRPVTISKQVRQTAHGTSGGSPVVYTGSFGYDDAGNRTTVVTPNREVTLNSYDGAGERVSTTDPLGNTTTTTYDLVGAPVRTTAPADAPGRSGRATTTTYDQVGRAVSVASLDESGAVVSTSRIQYDADGNVLASTDADGNTRHTEYNGLGQPVRQIQPVDATHNITTTLGYDAAGHRTVYTDGNGQNTYFTYNTLGLPESTVEPATPAYPNPADRTYTTAYDPNLQPVTVLKPGGVKIQNTYDPAGRITAQNGSGGEVPTPTRNIGYDLAGRITSVSTPNGPQTFSYEDRGMLWTSSGPQGQASFTYNADGLLASRTNAAGTANFGYDAAGRLKSFTDPLTTSTVGYAYNPSGTLQSVSYGSSTTRSFTYDGKQNLASDTLSTSGATKASVTYGYYPSGRLKTQNTTGLAGTPNASYTYDQSGRLSTWNKGDSTTSYGYDDNGNLTKSGATTATYNQRNQLLTAGANTYTFTPRGTRSSVSNGSTTSTAGYDAFDELVTQGGQTYSYDALGRLASTAGRTFGYDDASNHLVTDGTETYSRTPDGGLVSVGAAGAANFAYSNRHGDLVGTFTANGTAMAGVGAYDPWGKPDGTATTGSKIGYQGGWTDPASGQVSTASRWYDPATAEFTSRDSAQLATATSSAANLYSYANGDPMNAADPSGHRACVPFPVAAPRGGGDGGGDDQDPTPPAETTPPPADAPATEPAPAPAPAPAPDYGLAASQEYDIQKMLEQQRLDDAMHPFGYSSGSLDVPSWGVYASPLGAGGIPEMFGSIPWGGIFEGGALALNPFSRSSCDTPTGHHHPRPHGGGSTSPSQQQVDPHTLNPIQCTSCSTPAPPGALLNGPELGPTQQGNPGTAFGGQPVEPFNPTSVWDQSGLLLTKDSVALVGNAKFDDDEAERDCLNGGKSSVYYQPLDRVGRATGVQACLNIANINWVGKKTKRTGELENPQAIGLTNIIGTPTEYPIENVWNVPPGYKEGAGLNRGHLLARVLGGDGEDRRNLVPLWANANSPVMSSVEAKIASALKAGESIYFTSRPAYDGRNPLPDTVTLTAVGNRGTRIAFPVPNVP